MKTCNLCDRRKGKGNLRSHSMMATRRFWNINLHSVKLKYGDRCIKTKVCTKCLRSLKKITV